VPQPKQRKAGAASGMVRAGNLTGTNKLIRWQTGFRFFLRSFPAKINLIIP
jgi:hypothetical protein